MTQRLLQNTEPIPGYKLIERLGRGGYGEVWKAEAPGGIFKAIKFVYGDLDSSGEDTRAAEQELKALNRVKTIRHPFILSLERYDIIDGQLMIVMELADRNLWDRFTECRNSGLVGVPRPELLNYMEESAEALDLMNLHYQIQHLDIKPQNLFLVHNHIKVADFGLAKDFEGIRATVTGGVTPVYAAPETFEGWISRFSDQYSLAIVYQELLTAVRPFSGTSARQLLMQHISQAPDCAPLPPAERAIVARALSKKPDERYPKCIDFVKALRDSRSNPVSVLVAGTVPQTPAPAAAQASTQLGGGTVPMTEIGHTPIPSPPTVQSGSNGLQSLARKRLPALVTPNNALENSAITPGARASDGAPITQQRPVAFETGRLAHTGVAPPERSGMGVLRPVMVIGLGGLGLRAMQRLRLHLWDRYHSRTLPHFRWLYIDTDPESLQSATSGHPHEALDPFEVLPARLQRPAHYLSRPGLPAPDSWLPGDALYRIPRHPVTDGIRALGRLAFCDHYQAIGQKLRNEMEHFLQEKALADAEKITGQLLRTNRPRVYVLTSLSGGTGSGMLVDLAYVIRQEMRHLGFRKPSVSGFFFAPKVEPNATALPSVANSRAALLELEYFSRANTVYDTRLDTRQPAVIDPDAPFDRTMLFTLPSSQDSKTTIIDICDRIAGAVYQETLTPMGRTLDDLREVHQRDYPTEGMIVRSMNFRRLTWSRNRFMDVLTQLLSQHLLQRWMSKDAGTLQESVRAWVDQEWSERKLDRESVLERIERKIDGKFSQPVSAIVESRVQALAIQLTPGATVTSEAVLATVDEIVQLIGKFSGGVEEDPCQVGNMSEKACRDLAAELEVKLAQLAVYNIEKPNYRLPAAEEAIRHVIRKLQDELNRCDAEFTKLKRGDVEDYGRLYQFLLALAEDGSLKVAAGKRSASALNLIEALRVWSGKRIRMHHLGGLATVYRQLLGNAPEYLREVNFCRHQLGEIQRNLTKFAAPTFAEGIRQDQPILPAGSRTVEEASERFIKDLASEDWLELDGAIQDQIRPLFQALVRACLALNEHATALQELIVEQSRRFLDRRLGKKPPIEHFFARCTDAETARDELLKVYESSNPDKCGTNDSPEAHVTVVTIPPGIDGERFRGILTTEIKGTKLVTVPQEGELTILRERLILPLSELSLLQPEVESGAKLLQDQQDFLAHARKDVPWKQTTKEGSRDGFVPTTLASVPTG